MDTLLERWCENRPSHRVLCWCLSILFAGLAAWSMLLRPVDRLCAELQRQLMQDAGANASLWPVASKIPFSPASPKVQEMQPFSPLDFQGDGMKLVHWKPSQRGGELTLDAEWPAIPTIFSLLAQRDVQVAAFAIAPQDALLRLRLELESDHAK
ncbi:HofO [Enterobacter ludwigii]|uniref:HofO n=1 Tax=Enterobacter cloacae TaxID=550 RepID=A0A4Q2E5H1_ENTCL|nr:HofO [Enterobacter cloacae]RXW28307.1 HofO [Enterobacter cloacae]